jgi:hypothetical protein
MRIKVYCKIHAADGVSKIVRKSLELTEELIGRLDGYSPAIPNVIKSGDGFLGLLCNTGKIPYELFEETMRAFFSKNVELRKSFCAFANTISGISGLDANTLSITEALQAVTLIVADSNHTSEETYGSLLAMLGLVDGNSYIVLQSVTGDLVLTRKAYGVAMTAFGSDEFIQMIYKTNKDVVFIHRNGVVRLEDLPDKEVSCVPIESNNITIENHPIFHVKAKIDLHELEQPTRITKPWLSKVALFLDVNISGLETKDALDKIYEWINAIANQKENKPKKIYFLLKRDFVEKAPIKMDIQLDGKTLDKEQAIGLMARRQGALVLPGNPNFNEGTLRSGSTWYLAELIKE